MSSNTVSALVKGRKIDLPGDRSVFIGTIEGEYPIAVVMKRPDSETPGKTHEVKFCMRVDAAVTLISLLYSLPEVSSVIDSVLDGITNG